MSLEKEFAERVELHKYEMITSALILFERSGIYNYYLLKKKYGDSVMNDRGPDRAFYVADELLDFSKKGGQKIYDKIYEMCWRKIKYVICDTKAYNLDIEVEDENENKQITDDDLCKNADKIMECAGLTPCERNILRFHFGLDDGRKKSLCEVEELFGLTNDEIIKIEKNAIKKLEQSAGYE